MADLRREEVTDAPPVFTARPDRRKMTDWVTEELREAIIELRLRPGEPLREAALAEQLGVSKTPLREAFARLEQEGLVETTSFKGAVVTGYSERDLNEIYELRSLLEGAATRAAAERSSSETIEELRDLVVRSRELRDTGDLAGLAGLLEAFDVLVYTQVRNERIGALIENLRAHLTRIGKLTEGIPGRVEASVEEHAAIVEAIAARDADEAERRMRVHIGSVLADQLATRGSHEAGKPE
ncbi:MAG: GntR family transcriptional regulator [Actinomycetota bacterium]|nr:GntR family transcriptional regulator [Actinomycetota bacterium]